MTSAAPSVYRPLHPGMGVAVAERTYLRRLLTDDQRALLDPDIRLNRKDPLLRQWLVALHNTGGYHVEVTDTAPMRAVEPMTRWETWGEVAHRVAIGNVSLTALAHPGNVQPQPMPDRVAEALHLESMIAKGVVLMSGRHLQQGDEHQINRPMEVFTNCLDFSTRILTMEYGPVEVGKVAGQTVTVIAGDGQPRKALVHSHGVQPLQDIVFRACKGGGGKYRKRVTATPNHRWLLRDGSVTDNIKVGDTLRSLGFSPAKDPLAVIHGLLFGDGTAHKRKDSARNIHSAGRTYASIRVCKQDAVRDEIHAILDDAGYSYTTPPHAKGDRVYYIGKFPFAKELPTTTDPEYIAGFIYGWWLADGYKGLERAGEISTSDEAAVQWLVEYAGYAGLCATMERVFARREGDGSFANGKDLHIVRVRSDVEWRVESIEMAGEAEVFCPEEPVTASFVLANGLLTGNCSTASSSFALFYLLLNGSGVGRCYDDDLMVTNWDNMPTVRVVLDDAHPDFNHSQHMSVRDARHLYGNGDKVHWFEVPDSREGWAEAIELLEVMTYQKVYRDDLLVLDFSGVRGKGEPIMGMQGRPSSGPVPLMAAIEKIAKIKGAGLKPWRQTLYVDQYLAEPVLVGGARRAARMSTKHWSDPDIIEFIEVKRPIEFEGLTVAEVGEYVDNADFAPSSFLWSSNNSVTFDAKGWHLAKLERGHADYQTPLARRAREALKRIKECAYGDRNGEPGIINEDMLTKVDRGLDADAYRSGDYVGSDRYQVKDETRLYLARIAKIVRKKPNAYIVNPCGEIVLYILGAFCVIADVVPFHADSIGEAEEAVRAATRALMRVNLMDSIYNVEVKRSNRIGVGLTGVHEFAWKFFKVGFADLVNPDFDSLIEQLRFHGVTADELMGMTMKNPVPGPVRAAAFWDTLGRLSRAVYHEAVWYAEQLGVEVPHTMTTIKPSGSVSKLFGLTEGWHLPSMLRYLRWVQYRIDDPLVDQYRANGYPVRELQTYRGHVIVGFPTAPTITELDGIEDHLVTAGDATVEDQFKWLQLGEAFWLEGHDAHSYAAGVKTLPTYGNQISYTLKYKPDVVDFEHFSQMVDEHQPTVRCCSVMPQTNMAAFEYLPEESVNKAEFESIARAIQRSGLSEDIGLEHLECGTGACPVTFKEDKNLD